jgi:hypothetical protein
MKGYEKESQRMRVFFFYIYISSVLFFLIQSVQTAYLNKSICHDYIFI